MYKLFSLSILLISVVLINAQNKGDCNEFTKLISDHGGICYNINGGGPADRLIDSAYFNIGDTVLFSYGMPSISVHCVIPHITDAQIFKNGNPISVTPLYTQLRNYSTTTPGIYRFIWGHGGALPYLDFTIKLITNSPTSIDEPEEKKFINLFPNPSLGKFKVNLDFDNSNQVKVEIFDISGNLISKNIPTESILAIDISSHPKGFYLVKITNGQQVFVEKLVYQ
jgi:hypothetical protein